MHVVFISILGKPQPKKTVSDLGEFAAQSSSPTRQAQFDNAKLGLIILSHLGNALA